MEDVKMIKEPLTELFSNDPLIWAKWGLVFLSLVLTYIFIFKFKLYEKLNPSKRLDKKVRKAIQNNHVINATLVRTYFNRDEYGSKIYTGYYEYEINGKKRKYTGNFGTASPRDVLHLYYKDTPRRLFTNEVYRRYTITGLPLVILSFFPFIVAGLMIFLLGLDSQPIFK